MKLKPHGPSPFGSGPLKPFLRSLMACSDTQTPTTDLDDLLCSGTHRKEEGDGESNSPSTEASPNGNGFASPGRDLSGESRIERAWAHWTKLGRPKRIVAPMVDNSELPFRMLCRKYDAGAAYTPMLHSRIFTESEKYRNEEFSTCKEDRPLFVQFCANDPDILLEAARRVEPIAIMLTSIWGKFGTLRCSQDLRQVFFNRFHREYRGNTYLYRHCLGSNHLKSIAIRDHLINTAIKG